MAWTSMGTSRTRTAFRSLCFITCVSAHSSFFWSTEPRPVVREEALRQRRQSSFQEVERRIDEKPEPLPEVLDEAVHLDMCQAETPHMYNGEKYATKACVPEAESPSTTPSAASTTPSAASEKIEKIAKFQLGEAEDKLGAPEEKPEELEGFEFAKAEKVLKGIQGRLLIINDASDENHATIEDHRTKIKTQRTAFETFVNKLNQELEILRKGMKCINQGAQIIANIGTRHSFLETESGAFIDRGTALGVDDCGAIGSGSEGEETRTAAAAAGQTPPADTEPEVMQVDTAPNDDPRCEHRKDVGPTGAKANPEVWCLCNHKKLVIDNKGSCTESSGDKGKYCEWDDGESKCVPKAKTEAPAVNCHKWDKDGVYDNFDKGKECLDAGCSYTKNFFGDGKDKCEKRPD